MNFLEANLQVFRRRFPEAAQHVLAAEPEINIRFDSSKNGLPIVYERFGDREYPLHSTVDPTREAERLLRSSGNSGFIVVYGIGTAWHLEGLLEQKDREILIIVDGPGRLKKLMAGRDLRKILEHPRVTLLLDPVPEELSEHIIHSYLPGIHGGFSFTALPSLVTRRRDRYSLLQKAADQALLQVRNDFSVQAHFGLLWSRNCIANMAVLPVFTDRSDYERVFGASKKKAILIGAGPSLRDDRNLILQRAADSWIIAVDTSLPFLQQLNLIPDLVVSIDSQYYTLLHALLPGSLDIPWAITPSAPPALLRKLKKPLLFAGGSPLEQFLARHTDLPGMDTRGGNVLQASLSLAGAAGLEDLTIFGADYAQPGGIPYAPGTYVDHWFRIREKRTTPFLQQSLEFTFKGRLEQEVSEYDSLYPCKRLDRYRENMAEYLKSYPGNLTVHGASASLLLQRRGSAAGWKENPQLQMPDKVPKPRDLLREISRKLKNDEPGTLQILYPLIAYLRNRHSATGTPPDGVVTEARDLFLSLVSTYAGE